VGLLQRRLGIAYTTTSSPGRFSLALEVGREKDIFVWTGKNDSKMERVEASYFSKKNGYMWICGWAMHSDRLGSPIPLLKIPHLPSPGNDIIQALLPGTHSLPPFLESSSLV